MLKLGEIKNFTVVFFGAEAICGGVFALRSGKWHWTRAAGKKLSGAKDVSTLWRELWNELRGGEDLIVISGTVAGGVLFSLDSIALPGREQREALLMELPRRMLRPPTDPEFQFLPVTAPDSEGMEALNVYAFECKKMSEALAPMRRARLRADEFIHPLLAVTPDDPAVFLPEIDRDFYFQNRKFHHADGAEAMLEEARKHWISIMNSTFVREAEDTELPGSCAMLLTARFIASGSYRRRREELRVLPDELHPVRFRRQLRLTAVLAAILCIVWLWGFSRERWKDFSNYRAVVAETGDLRHDVESMEGSLRRALKEQKDISKVINSSFGEREIIDQLAAFSKLLPSDVMVSELRWSESGIDLTLQSESDNLDLPRVLKPLSRWKVTDIQQRQGRFSATTTVTAKLLPAESSNSKNKGTRK